jgi:DNA-directed RNA polymerase subunit RPC12/RpoP
VRQVALFYDAEEAQVARGFLRSRGLKAVLPDEQTLGVRPELRIALGGYRLLVPYEEAFQASALLREVEAADVRPSCEACGSKALRRERRWWFPLAVLFLFRDLFPFAPARAALRCRACGHTQAPSDATEEAAR